MDQIGFRIFSLLHDIFSPSFSKAATVPVHPKTNPRPKYLQVLDTRQSVEGQLIGTFCFAQIIQTFNNTRPTTRNQVGKYQI